MLKAVWFVLQIHQSRSKRAVVESLGGNVRFSNFSCLTHWGHILHVHQTKITLISDFSVTFGQTEEIGIQ